MHRCNSGSDVESENQVWGHRSWMLGLEVGIHSLAICFKLEVSDLLTVESGAPFDTESYGVSPDFFLIRYATVRIARSRILSAMRGLLLSAFVATNKVRGHHTVKLFYCRFPFHFRLDTLTTRIADSNGESISREPRSDTASSAQGTGVGESRTKSLSFLKECVRLSLIMQ